MVTKHRQARVTFTRACTRTTITYWETGRGEHVREDEELNTTAREKVHLYIVLLINNTYIPMKRHEQPAQTLIFFSYYSFLFKFTTIL